MAHRTLGAVGEMGGMMATSWTESARTYVGLTVGVLLMAALPEPAGGEFNPGNRSLADKLRYGPGLTNHPVHVIPSSGIKVPRDWPLDFDGSITCLTCHYSLPSLEGASEVYLRSVRVGREDRVAFCANCHDGAGRSTAGKMHWMAIGFAHIEDSASRTGLAGGRLDAESSRCLGCHDGVSAPEAVNATAGAWGGGFSVDPRRDHPIGMPYRPRSGVRGDVPLRAAALLPHAIRLPQGRVSCVSCHNLYAATPKLLSVPIEGSALCMTCHELD